MVSVELSGSILHSKVHTIAHKYRLFLTLRQFETCKNPKLKKTWHRIESPGLARKILFLRITESDFPILAILAPFALYSRFIRCKFWQEWWNSFLSGINLERKRHAILKRANQYWYLKMSLFIKNQFDKEQKIIDKQAIAE